MKLKSEEAVRIDKWLWSIRLFKTRAKAQIACKKGEIFIGDNICKPSKLVKIGDIVLIRTGSKKENILVKGLISKRVSAKIAVELYEKFDNSFSKNSSF